MKYNTYKLKITIFIVIVKTVQSLIKVTYIIEFDTASYSKHFLAQLSCMHEANSITLDPHKSGFCPYPAGGLLYRYSQGYFFSSIITIPADGLLYTGLVRATCRQVFLTTPCPPVNFSTGLVRATFSPGFSYYPAAAPVDFSTGLVRETCLQVFLTTPRR